MGDLEQDKTSFLQLVNSKWRFKGFLLKHLPMAFLAGLTVRNADEQKAAVSISLNYLTKNPFHSIYFACLAMAAELATGILAMNAIEKSGGNFSLLVTGLEADFTQKATGTITFRSEDGEGLQSTVQQCLKEQAAITYTATSIGINRKGETVAKFSIQWSLKAK